MHIYICIYIYMHMYIYIYIYICIASVTPSRGVDPARRSFQDSGANRGQRVAFAFAFGRVSRRRMLYRHIAGCSAVEPSVQKVRGCTRVVLGDVQNEGVAGCSLDSCLLLSSIFA